MGRSFTFSSESVGEGHPDKVADAISDAILDACLEQDPHSRVACETLIKSNTVHLAGEISTQASIDTDAIARACYSQIGYPNADKLNIINSITEQSPEIAQGVDPSEHHEQGAGDQGIMFGYACDETPELMPSPIMFAHRITRRLGELRKAKHVDWLMPDCKAQVAIDYLDEKPQAIRNIVISTQHTDDPSDDDIRNLCIDEVIADVIPKHLITPDTQFFINPAGRFIIGGPDADAGLTGRKIIVDTYGGWSRHGGGAFSGKDASKVDRSAAYMCRYVAKNLVALNLCSQAEIQVAYAIGRAEPTSIHLNTFHHSNTLKDSEIREWVLENFSFKPADIVQTLDLLKPIYSQTAAFGHFGKSYLPWEQTADNTNIIPGKRQHAQ